MPNFSLGQKFIALLLPTNCLGCGVEGEWICDYCLANLPTQNDYRCVICAKAAENGLCELCRRSTKIDGIVSSLPYKDPVVQKLIIRAKYYGYFDALRFFAQKFGRQLIRRLPHETEFTAVPIPLHPNRLKDRGYNQTEVLAKEICQGNYEVKSVLKRVKDTAAQAKLEKDKRQKNIKNCFVAESEAPSSVLLFDDVITTGATLREAARILRKAGCQEIWVITIAHG